MLVSFSFSCTPSDEKPVLKSDELYTDTFDQLEDFWITSEISDPSRMKIVPDPTDSSNNTVRFFLYPDDFVNNGKRNELVLKTMDKSGYTVKYSFRFMLPPDFFKKREHDWIMIHQWHDEPPYGLDWHGYDMQTHPPINLTVKLTPGEKYYIIFNYGLWNKEINELQVAQYKKPLKPHQWYTFENTVHWNFDKTGYSQPSIDGTYLFNDEEDGKVYGANVYNEVGNYFKMGLYGNKKQRDTISIYFDDFGYQLSSPQPD